MKRIRLKTMNFKDHEFQSQSFISKTIKTRPGQVIGLRPRACDCPLGKHSNIGIRY